MDNKKQQDLHKHKQQEIQKQQIQQLTRQQNSTDQQFQTKIKSGLDQLAYKNVINELQSLANLQDIDFVNRRRSMAGKIIRLHLQKMYNLFAQPNELINSADLDAIIELISHSITAYTNDYDACLMLNTLLKVAIQHDVKYVFMIYRAQSLSFDQNKNNQQQITRKIKYLTSLYLFVPKILTTNLNLFDDFIDMVKEVLKIFISHFHGESEIINQSANKQQAKQTQTLSIYQTYLNFADHILHACLVQIQTNPSIQDEPSKINILIQSSISHLLSISVSDKTNSIKNYLVSIIKAKKDPLQLKQLKNVPQVLLICIVKDNNLINLLSTQRLLYILSRILLKYSPEYTTGSQVGNSSQEMDSFIEQIVVFICRIVLAQNSKIKIQGQKIYVDSEIFIDLIPLYKRMLVLLGFLSPEHSKQCGQLIKTVLKFRHKRYETCSLSKIAIWSQLMDLAGSNEYEYRIFCISEYRKLLIQHRNSIVKGNFQSHPYHTHTLIFMNGHQRIQNQMQMVMLFGITNINCDYIGHVVSLISNWLTVAKSYCNKYNNYHIHKIIKSKQDILELTKKLQQKMNKHLQIIKQQNTVTAHQLVLFRISQLDFNWP